jgi:hypothetical protein
LIVSVLAEQLHASHATVQHVENHPTRSNTSRARHPQNLSTLRGVVNKRTRPPFQLPFPLPLSAPV